MKRPYRVSDTDIRGVEPALKRAAGRAREIAKATRTALVVREDGKVVKKWIK